jgi:hypothetical protein
MDDKSKRDVSQGMETTPTATYEAPSITDYGTLMELTAGKGNGNPDFHGSWDKKDGGGSYS